MVNDFLLFDTLNFVHCPYGHRQLIFWYAFPPDSSKMDRTQIKKTPPPFNFFIAPDSTHISRTIGPTELVHLSIFAGIYRKYYYSVLEMTFQTFIVQKLSENWM